ncbi:N-acetylmuramoyl-L-alanine amidase family protein [Frigoriflavimonas asaccharolytica]|uniref:N-acetylmuramoyl-L-alanine amidase n=1 Tax=Frigoriflavimonas asaccharolytica TaxID=2735899 RepID=A0A8J8K8J9_9FLAO|nr:N-acetylmuramoyl-L-alanine amidase [Frigoriflavimonas asaccharolytica]NRS92716.1 N-acetylmuramoyl-L-alanine amidase [Frigoriflavimonas asaccharolytica]
MIKTNSLKKYFFLALIFFSSISNAQKKFTIVLDAGHGGSDIGANRKYDFGYPMEKDITLAIVLKLGAMLEANKNFHVIYTRKTDFYPSLTDRTDLANSSKADLFMSIHVNSSPSRTATARGTETFVQGPGQNRENLEVAKRENDVIYLNDKDKQTLASYDPNSPESLISLKIQQSKYLEKSLLIGGYIEENFDKGGRFSRGVKQTNLHILRMSATTSVLVETGFVNNPEDAVYLSSEQGQKKTADEIYDAIQKYYSKVNNSPSPTIVVKEKPVETPLKNDFRILLMSTNMKYTDGHPALRGLKYILPIKENGFYKYYYSVTNFASIRDNNLKTSKDAGFRNAYAVGFIPNQKLNSGYYTIEVAVSESKLSNSSPILSKLKDVEREKEGRTFYYTWGKASTLEEAVALQDQLEKMGITDTTLQKVNK